ncbi:MULTISPECIES: ATP-binding protein [unclassified Butyrivibrio]|uniref:ATP-binding protein n=1 Tax=unclassified Butyrivibrio TaxID=2639466 RepID=UPI0008E5BDB2|nr:MULTISPECIES: ATP-binding protein [unclassified Butyrivibrio]RKM60275.1 DNA replication protein DnaC [Butyrivibrio sp. XB500-5]SFU95233.1 DNA replication protein DnaC [Butyrivibrio sp. INlla21]
MALSNAQFDEIMHEYEERRALHRQELEERQRYVYDTVPGYKELEDKTATASVDFGRRLLSGERLDKSALKRELEELARQKKTLLTEAGFSDDYLDMGYTCSDCKDTGYIGNEKCHCFKQKIIETLYDRSNLKTLAKTANFKLLTDKYYQGEDLKRFQGAVKASEKFINNFNSDYQNLFIYGTVGVGKSFLSTCVANELLKKGHSVIYFSSSGLFELLAENSFDYRNKQELKSIYDDIYNCELLIIDDLGTERTNSFVASELFSCLNERDLRKKSTVITTNLSLEELQATYSERIFSRVTSNYTLLKLTGQDIRKIKKIARKESEDFQ